MRCPLPKPTIRQMSSSIERLAMSQLVNFERFGPSPAAFDAARRAGAAARATRAGDDERRRREGGPSVEEDAADATPKPAGRLGVSCKATRPSPKQHISGGERSSVSRRRWRQADMIKRL